MNSLRLYTDEDVDGRLADALSRRGFDVLSCFDADNAGLRHSDEWQLTFAVENERAILTHNIGDYTAIARRWAIEGRSHFGIVFARQLSLSELVARTAMLLAETPPEHLHNGTFWLP